MRAAWLLVMMLFLSRWKQADSFSHGVVVAPAVHQRMLNVVVRRQTLSKAFRPHFSTNVFVQHEELEKEGEVGLEKVPTTLLGAIQRFFLGPDIGPRTVVAILLGFALWRSSLGSLRVGDVAVFGVTIVFWWFQEHIFHEHGLHSEMDWMGKRIHKVHHDKPYFHVSIDPASHMIGWLLASHVLMRCILRSTRLALSASLGYTAAGLAYEWAHYLVHTKVRPTNRLWKRVRDNHMKHHLVDKRYWFSFTLPVIDDWFRTNPDVNDVRKSNAAERSIQ